MSTPALRNPATWRFVVVAGLAAFVTTFSYLGAFLNPDANARNLPIALVNEDRGAEFGGKRVVLGQQVMATLTLLNAFGIAGELVALFFVIIFGVPSAGGVYPVQALPAFFRFLNGWLPLRFVTDGARALIFFEWRTVGLDQAVAVLSIYTIAATAAGAALTLWIDARRKSRLARAVTASAVAVVS